MYEVEYWYESGSFGKAKKAIHRAIGQYAYNNSYIYIGLTQQNPRNRFGQHQRKWAKGHKWDKMIVIFKARSFNKMVEAEDELISYAKKKIANGAYSCELINDIDSQKPKKKAIPDGYWIYIMVQK